MRLRGVAPQSDDIIPLVAASSCDPASSDLAQLAGDWWEHQRLSSGSREERKSLELGGSARARAARDLVDETVQRGGSAAVELLAVLADATPLGDDGTAVGAGPLEDLIHEHGDDLIDEVVSCARQRPRFAQALAIVWAERGHLTAGTEDRLRPWVGRFTSNS